MEHMGILDVVVLVAEGIFRVRGVLGPERRIEACLVVRVQPHLKDAGAFHEVHALNLYPDIPVHVLAVFYVHQLRQFVQQLVSGISHVVGLFHASGFDGPDGIVQRQNLLSVGIDLIHVIPDLQVQIVLIGGKAGVYGLGPLNQLRAPLHQEPLGHRTGGILGQLLNGRPEIFNRSLEGLAVHLAQLSLHLFHHFGRHLIEHTAPGLPAVYFIKEIIPYMFYSGICDAQAHLLIADGTDVHRKRLITSGGLLHLLPDIAGGLRVSKIMRCGVQRILTGL